MAWGRSLTRRLALSGNLNVASVSDARERFRQWATSLSVGYDLSEGWGTYAEVYGLNRTTPAGPSAITANAGVSRSVGRNIQLDAEVGRGLTRQAADWFVGFGIAVRRPLKLIS